MPTVTRDIGSPDVPGAAPHGQPTRDAMTAILGCIADDLTGATDLAGRLVAHGMRAVQAIGVPDGDWPDEADAVVVALKSRTIAAEDAIRQSLDAQAWLARAGCDRVYFKYCSTFDSTDRGNIGPVAEALMDATGTAFTIACPAFPATRRTIYQGMLFVNGVPLDESGMERHPLTPMTDANLVRVLQRQTRRRVGLLDYETVARGASAIADRAAALEAEGCGLAIVDAVFDRDLDAIAEGCATLRLLTGASGVAQALPAFFRRHGRLAPEAAVTTLPAVDGSRAVIAGSCSRATREQVDVMRAARPALAIDPIALASGRDVVGDALAWAARHLGRDPILIYSTAAPDAVAAAQAALGAERAAALVETALAAIARGLVDLGVGQLIVAGGETAGAVVAALGVRLLRIGPEIDPGVPWTLAVAGARPLALALKSGNFGRPDFFLAAWSRVS